jgi:integrase
LKKARETAAEFLLNLKNTGPGISSAMSFAELAAEWLDRFKDKYTQKEYQRKIFLLERYIFPELSDITLKDISAYTILSKVIRPVENLNHINTAHKVKSLISLIMRYGIVLGQVENDPAAGLNGALKPENIQHRAAIIDPAKIGRLMDDIRNYKGTVSVTYALNILPYVFVRPGEIRWAQWKEFNLEEAIWRIPAKRMKMKAPHLVPLAAQVVGLLKELKKINGNNEFLFPGLRSATKPISDAAINAALRYLGYGADELVAHGFRAMASTLLNEQGFSPDWIERQLAHAERNKVRAAYNHADYLQERQKMMRHWADYLDHLRLIYVQSKS